MSTTGEPRPVGSTGDGGGLVILAVVTAVVVAVMGAVGLNLLGADEGGEQAANPAGIPTITSPIPTTSAPSVASPSPPPPSTPSPTPSQAVDNGIEPGTLELAVANAWEASQGTSASTVDCFIGPTPPREVPVGAQFGCAVDSFDATGEATVTVTATPPHFAVAITDAVPILGPPLYPGTPLSVGPPEERPLDVQAVQARLNVLGYGPVEPDGQFSQLTVALVAAFQSDSGLAPSGTVDEQTWTLLFG